MVVPDALGYGESDKPTELSSYTTKNLAKDMIALLDAENISQIIVVAHDWGAYTGWRMALWYPERVRMIVWSVTLVNRNYAMSMCLLAITQFVSSILSSRTCLHSATSHGQTCAIIWLSTISCV